MSVKINNECYDQMEKILNLGRTYFVIGIKTDDLFSTIKKEY